ncbi:MAG: hypothetical protein ACKOOC_00825 [Cyanobium sp.]
MVAWMMGSFPIYRCHQRVVGSDEGDAPLLRDGDGAPGECEVVIGGEQGDQTESQATDGLGEAEVVRAFTAGPGDLNGDQAENVIVASP